METGDWAVDRYNGDMVIIVAQTGKRGHSVEFWESYEEGQVHTGLLKNFIPLFTLDQLLEMLEEKGWEARKLGILAVYDADAWRGGKRWISKRLKRDFTP